VKNRFHKVCFRKRNLYHSNEVWTGDAYTLNLVKCAVGSVGFAAMGVLTLGSAWLSTVTPAALAWAGLHVALNDAHWSALCV
jgi:hypothetical protein